MSELIDKYFAGEMTCEEKKDLFDRIESDEALKKEFLRMQNVVALTQILSLGSRNYGITFSEFLR